MSLTPLAVAALALLAERPMHPYEMYQLLLERREDRMVKVRPGSLYHTIERLHGAEFVTVTGTGREGNRPERTTYAVTNLGREALAARISNAISQPAREYPQFPHALSEAHNLPADEAVSHLAAYADALDEEISEIAAFLEAAQARGTEETYVVGDQYLHAATVAQRDWIRTLITRIENKDFIWQPHLG